MRLPAHLLQQIVGHPVAHFSGSGHKRALGRLTLETPASVYPIHGDILENPIQVTVHDISAETVGLVSPQAMMPSANLAVRISLPNGESIAIRCRVTRCVRQADGRFSLVARFLEMIELPD
jgi:PilZ domain